MKSTIMLRNPIKRRSHKHVARAWLIWGITALFVLFQFSIQLSTGVIVNGLESSFHIHAFAAGLIASAYYYVYVTLQTPAGLLMDRFGPRRLLTLGCLVASIGCFCFAISQQPLIAGISRVIIGCGTAFAFVGSLYIIAKWFPSRHFGLIVGIAETVGMLGAIFGNIYMADVISHFGWRDVMLGAVVVGLVIASLSWLVIRDKPKHYQRIERQYAHQRLSFRQSLQLVVGNRVLWINGLFCGIMFSLATVFVALWGIPFLSHAYGLSPLQSTITASVLFLGIAVGGPIMGAIAAHLRDRRVLLCISALLVATLMLTIIYLPPVSLSVLIVLLFLAGALSSVYVVNYTIANELVPEQAKSTSIGFTNTLNVLPAPLLQPLAGYILDRSAAQHSASLQHFIYTSHDYQIALSILPIFIIIAAVSAWWIKQD